MRRRAGLLQAKRPAQRRDEFVELRLALGGVFVAFLLPFLDIGIVQSPMLNPEPTTLSRLLPGYGGSRVLLDGALTARFDETRPLLIGLAWLAALAVTVALVYRHTTRPARTR